ncbi:TetR/AcrR family transcriptional regulator [Nocardia sp. NPDC049149]|uniref:TetR/AcrR family transcriptional regulator n=1 Tax=Nocardia sp. NPDC049149 TaxID=3364315 RepID=UPI0037200DE9
MVSEKGIPPAQRLLDAAVLLFYAEGIHAVGVERLIAEAGVTKATFYRHYRSKDDLVVAYLAHKDTTTRAALLGATADLEPQQALPALFAAIAAYSCGPGFRGCPFINAASEYPDRTHPVRQAVTAHRTWLRTTLSGLLTALDHPEPESTARQLVYLRDGILMAGYLDSPDAVDATARHALRGIIGEHTVHN